MTIIDSFKTKKNIQIDSKNYIFFDLNALASKFSLDLNKVPVTLKILLENLLRHEDGITINKELISDFCSNLSFSNKKLRNQTLKMLNKSNFAKDIFFDIADKGFRF